MIDNDFLRHDELDPKQETRNQLLRGKILGACGAAVVVKTCMATKLHLEQPYVLEKGKLVQIYSCHDRVRLVIVHEQYLKVDDTVLVCSENDIALVPENFWAALFPVSLKNRLLIAEDSKLVEELASIEKGSNVEVLFNKEEIARGIVEYKNTLSSLRFGIYYGLRILNKRECLSEIAQISCLPFEAEDLPNQCDIVVTIDKIRLKNRNTSETPSYKSSMHFPVNKDVCDPPWLPKSLSHHVLRPTGDPTARRQASRSLDLSSKIQNNAARLINNSPLNKVHSSSKSLELPDSSSRRLTRGRACASLDSDIPVQNKRNGVEDAGGLTEESLVEILDDHTIKYGVIRRIYRHPGADALMAEVEMEDDLEEDFGENGYLTAPYCKIVSVPLERCRRDSRFQDKSRRRNNSVNSNAFGLIECPSVEGIIPPISADFKEICGKNRGIQGHHNSCYLDATLFSMFAFTSVIDSILYRPRTKQDIPEYEQVQRVLRDEIVNPLRKNLYVRADRVMKLRTLLDRLSSVSGLTSEEKDPEEFLNSLLTQILRAEPFLLLSSDQKAFHYQLFVEKDPSLTLPSVQQLLEQSFTASDIKLKQLPSCLIVQMPRFGKAFKMYPRILPSTVLDVTDVIQDSPRQCTSCGKLAEMECKDCYTAGLEGSSFCTHCLETAHSHFTRSNHKMRKLAIPVEFAELQEHCSVPRLNMNLFAVVCIETSHYVTFLNTSQGWVFFDSMADRKGEQNGYNIPEIVNCPDLPYWLSEDGARQLQERQDDRDLPELAKRLLCDAYMCMYQSPDVMMYK